MGQEVSLNRAKIKVRRIQYKGANAHYPIHLHSSEPIAGRTVFYLTPSLLTWSGSEWSKQRLKTIMKTVKLGKSVKIEYEYDTGVLRRIGEFDLMIDPKNE